MGRKLKVERGRRRSLNKTAAKKKVKDAGER